MLRFCPTQVTVFPPGGEKVQFPWRRRPTDNNIPPRVRIRIDRRLR